MIYLGFMVFLVVGKPFQDLDLAMSFSKLKNHLCIEEGILNEGKILDAKYKEPACSFYIFWFIVRQLP